MPAEFSYPVFLSHSAKDKPIVRASSLSASNGERAGVPASPKPGEGGRCRSFRLAEGLRKDGLKVWPVPPKRPREGGFDEWVLKAGNSIPAKIEEELEHPEIELQPSAFRLQPLLHAPLNKERRILSELQPSAFILQPFLATPIKGLLAQLLCVN